MGAEESQELSRKFNDESDEISKIDQDPSIDSSFISELPQNLDYLEAPQDLAPNSERRSLQTFQRSEFRNFLEYVKERVMILKNCFNEEAKVDVTMISLAKKINEQKEKNVKMLSDKRSGEEELKVVHQRYNVPNKMYEAAKKNYDRDNNNKDLDIFENIKTDQALLRKKLEQLEQEKKELEELEREYKELIKGS